VADQLLQSIDDLFAAQTSRRLARSRNSDRAADDAPADASAAGPGAATASPRLGAAVDETGVAAEAAESARRLGRIFDTEAVDVDLEVETSTRRQTLWDYAEWVEIFIAIQFLWGAMVFVPGAQQYRGIIRALPYMSSLGMLALYALRRTREPLPRSGGLIAGALLLLVFNLLHPTSQLNAGLAQCIFQLSIAAPLFFAHKAVRSAALVERLLVLIFVLNALSAGLGVLQVYYPERFMPSEFNSLGFQMNQYYLDGLTYQGSDGRYIVRPPGLTDQPGAAATAGAFTALLGLGLLLRRRQPVPFAAILAAVTVGFAAIYLSQVRSILLATIGASALLSVVALRRGRFAGAGWMLTAGAAIVVGSFIWAASIGGASVTDRFLGLQEAGVVEAYRTGRGGFLEQTTGELLDRYPLGAGVGRWGMMNTYFGNPFDYRSEPIYVEIQLTGWLLDGGILMWLLYGSGTLLSIWAAFSMSDSQNPLLSEVAIIGLGLQAYVLSLAMSAPVFNSQMGILFWTIAGALHGAAREVRS
jgi:hypothetical protein